MSTRTRPKKEKNDGPFTSVAKTKKGEAEMRRDLPNNATLEIDKEKSAAVLSAIEEGRRGLYDAAIIAMLRCNETAASLEDVSMRDICKRHTLEEDSDAETVYRGIMVGMDSVLLAMTNYVKYVREVFEFSTETNKRTVWEVLEMWYGTQEVV